MYSYSKNTPAAIVTHAWDICFICQSKESYKASFPSDQRTGFNKESTGCGKY